MLMVGGAPKTCEGVVYACTSVPRLTGSNAYELIPIQDTRSLEDDLGSAKAGSFTLLQVN
jgi:hypothetical protein